MFLKRSLLAASLLGLSATASSIGSSSTKPSGSEARSQDWFLVECVVQINVSKDELHGLLNLLQSQAYIGSVSPGTVLTEASAHADFFTHLRSGGTAASWEASGAELPSSGRLTLLDSQALAGNLFAFGAASTSEQQARGAVQNILDNLDQHLGRGAQRAEEAMLRAREEMHQTEQELHDLQSMRSEARGEFGGVDPASWLLQLRERLMRSRSSLMDMESDLSVRRSVRDYQAERLASMPSVVMVAGDPVRNPAYTELDVEISSLRAETSSLLHQLQRLGSAPAVQKQRDEMDAQVTELTERMAVAEARLENTEKFVPGPQVERPNADYRRLESEVLQNEQLIAERSAEMEATQNTLRRLETEVARYEELVFHTQELEQRAVELQHAVSRARHAFDLAKEKRRAADSNPLVVISGPTTVRLGGR